MSPACVKLIYSRTISSSQHIIKNNNWSIVFMFWFNFTRCFIIWILSRCSGYYMNRSFVTYFFKYFENVLSFTNVFGSNNNMGVVFKCWNVRVFVIVSFLRKNNFVFVVNIFLLLEGSSIMVKVRLNGSLNM